MTDEDRLRAFWQHRGPDREHWWLIGALVIWLTVMVLLIVGVIPTG